MKHMMLAIGLLAVLSSRGVSDARADELVQVATHQASLPRQQAGLTPPLLGFLTRPFGPGRFPAVVLLHWCSGFSEHDAATAATLKNWGYVALAIDSLGDANVCDGEGGSASEAIDAFAALHYLSEQNFVASHRIAVMGFSMGGLAALITVDNWPVMRSREMQFRAAVAYYPPCQYITGDLTAPALVLIGEQDDWSRPDACQKLAAKETDIGITRKPGAGEPVDLVMYPYATHAFDSDHPPRRYLGHFMRYDPTATTDAEAKVHAFLRARFAQ